MRAFFAVHPMGPASSVLLRALSEFSRTPADARWCRAEGLHVTLAFLGGISDEAALKALAAARPAARALRAFELTLEGLGAFPSWESPGVLWAGVGAGAEELSRLAEALRGGLNKAGFPTEERPFLPHVTLGRLRGRRGWDSLRPIIEKWRAPGSWEDARCAVASFEFMESRLGPGGANYRLLERIALA